MTLYYRQFKHTIEEFIKKGNNEFKGVPRAITTALNASNPDKFGLSPIPKPTIKKISKIIKKNMTETTKIIKDVIGVLERKRYETTYSQNGIFSWNNLFSFEFTDYANGEVDFEEINKSPNFNKGIADLKKETKNNVKEFFNKLTIFLRYKFK